MKKPTDEDERAINNAVAYFIIEAKDGDYNTLKARANSLYERAWRKGFEAGKTEGKKEGRVKTKTVYETVDPNEDWGDFKG